MIPPYPSQPAPSGEGPPGPSDPWARERALQIFEAKLRTASIITIVGGSLLVFFSLAFAVVGLITAEAAVVWLTTLFGILPGIAIIVAGAFIGRPGGAARSMANFATACALLSLLSLGGFLIGAALTFVGTALARSAVRSMQGGQGPSSGALPPQGYGISFGAAYGAPGGAPPPAAPYFEGYAGPPPVPAAPYPAPTTAYAPPYGPSPAYGAAYPPPPAYPPAYGAPPYAAAPSPTPWGTGPLAAAPPAAPPPAPAPAPAAAAPLPPLPASDDEAQWRKSTVATLLAMDADQGFDLEALNLIDYARLKAQLAAPLSEGGARAERRGHGAQGQEAQLKARVEQLLRRIDQDTADINTVDDILRDRAVLWYRDSPGDAAWAATRSLWWSGLVSESRTAGGARTPALAARLGELRDALGGAPEGPKRGLFGFGVGKPGELSPAPKPSESLPARVVQAVLDDMSETPRAPGAPLSLLRLAELAAKATPAAVNQALADLFKADPRGPVVLIHPSRYPGFEFVVVRMPPPGAAGAAIAYEVVCAPPDAPSPGAVEVPQGAAVPRVIGAAPLDVSPAVWTDDALGAPGWAAVLAELERRRDRLAAPPQNFRKLPSYFALRTLVLGDAAARRTFLAVKWRGKPPGIGLLALLLEERALTPEVDTDGEYLEAELSDIERGDAQWHPADGKWQVAQGVAVVRVQAGGAAAYKVA